MFVEQDQYFYTILQVKLSQRNGINTNDQRAAWWDEFSIANQSSSSVRIEVKSVYRTAVYNGIVEAEFYIGQGTLWGTKVLMFQAGDLHFKTIISITTKPRIST